MPTPEHHDSQGEESLRAPQKLVAALKALPPEPVFIPPTLDEAVLRAARARLGSGRAPGLDWRRFLPWVLAGTTAVVLLVVNAPWERRPPTHPGNSQRVLAGDLNRDGRVDILDAFALARQLRAGVAASALEDLNGDGVVDERDVAELASRAVRLEKGGRS